ncbi:MAG: DUF192 domain-containing protein, partial [Planctomycetes bacterium]|nr:DUF192 domain-containing protein [Planctomycetota bacterium]
TAMRRRAWILASITAAAALCGCGKGRGGVAITGMGVESLRIRDVPFVCEVVWTADAIQRGLMYRESLPDDHGMLFVFAEPDTRDFWMKNTVVPLSIAYIDGEGRILQIEDMAPRSLYRHRSKEKVPFALEMHQGWFRNKGIGVGDRIEDLGPIEPYRKRVAEMAERAAKQRKSRGR